MSSSKCKLLLDENVRRELYLFLKKHGAIAKFCLSETRILVTNDEDFPRMSAKEIPGVVWLKIPQNDPAGLIKTFFRVLAFSPSDFKGTLVTLFLSHQETGRLDQ